MRANVKTEGMSTITSKQHIKDIEAYCRKIHAEAVINSFIMLFTIPSKAADSFYEASAEQIAPLATEDVTQTKL